MLKFFILTLFLLSFEAESAEDLCQLKEGRRFLAKKLSNETVQKADEIRLEGLRVIKKLQSFNPMESLANLGSYGFRLQYLIRNDPTVKEIITIFEKPIERSNDLINIIRITKITSTTGIVIGGSTQTDYDLILSYVRDAITELFPVGAKKIFEENPRENASILMELLDLEIQILEIQQPRKAGKKKIASARARRKIEEERSLNTEEFKEGETKNEEGSGTAVGIQKALIAAEITAAKESSEGIAEIRSQEGYLSEMYGEEIHEEEVTASASSAASASVTSTAGKSTSFYDQLMEITQSSFFESWFSKQDIKKIDDLFDEAISADSLVFYNFLKNLTKKQRNVAYQAEFREAHGGSHKLAILVSETGKKVLFPFAHHAGKDLDRHSRDLLIDGFKELFGFSA